MQVSKLMADNPQIAITLKLGSVACIAALAACVHSAASQGVPVGQIMAFRAGLSLVIIAVWGGLTAPVSAFRPRKLRTHLVRGGLACLAMFLTYVAYAALPVAQAQVLSYLSPILVLPIAALVLGERMTPGVVLAMTVALFGVVLIVGVNLEIGLTALKGALSGLAAAALVAYIQVLVRQMTGSETTLSIALSFSVIVTLVSAATWIFGDWVEVQGSVFWMLAAAGLFGAGTLVLNTEAVARAPVSLLAPYEFCGLIAGLGLDLVLFDYVPTLAAAIGSLLITGAAVTVTLQRSKVRVSTGR